MPSESTPVKVLLPFPARIAPKAAVQLWEKDQSPIIKQCPAYPNTPAVQTAVTECDAAVAALDGTVGEIDQLRTKLQGLEKTRNVQLGTVHVKHDAVETACTSASNNDPQAAKAWTGKTASRTKALLLPVGTGAPMHASLDIIKRHSGSVMGRCDEDPDAIGYLFQYGTDANHPDAWAQPTQMTGYTFKLRGLPVGQVLYMRIAILRRGSVQGAWSAMLQVTVR